MTDHLDLSDWPLAVRYLGGDCSPEERAQLEAQLADDPVMAARFESLQEIRDAWASRRPPVDMSAAWSKLSDRVLDHDGEVPALSVPHGSRAAKGWTVWAFAIAAALVVSVTTSYHVLKTRAALVLGQPSREFVTTAGQRLRVTLADGTRLTLGPASRLRVPVDYGQRAGSRAVDLVGEAYFEVVHNASHPFAVHTATALVQDVGTKFDLRAYPDDDATWVAVAEGRVAVTAEENGATDGLAHLLNRDDIATVSHEQISVLHRANLETFLAWQQGSLVFQATPLRAAVRDLARTFDLQITVADSTLLAQPITASIGQEPVDDVLTAVTFAIGARYERVGRRVVIRRASRRDRLPAASKPDAPLTLAHVADNH